MTHSIESQETDTVLTITKGIYKIYVSDRKRSITPTYFRSSRTSYSLPPTEIQEKIRSEPNHGKFDFRLVRPLG